MPAVGWRALLLDVPLALLIGATAWFSAQAARWFQHDLDGGPWRDGPPFSPPFPRGFDGVSVWWLPLPFVVTMIVGLSVRRLFPRLAFLLVIGAVTGFLAIGGPYGPVLIGPALALLSMAAALPPNRWLPLAVLVIPMLTAGFWTQPYLGFLDPRAYAAVLFGTSAIMLPTLIGLLVRNRRETERAVREQALRKYGFEERLRVAREVHDVVGHSLSVINLQAGVALHVLERRPEQVSEALVAIRNTSREALAELRSTLEVFKDPDLRLAPTAGLDRLDDLVSSLRAAGRTVLLSDERSQSIATAVDAAAFRIVQEALTNVVRHTDDAVASVTLRTERDSLVIMVSDDGPRRANLIEGSGITGMRERAHSVGGELTVELADSGVVVSARLPLLGRSELGRSEPA
jgi:signal transduction histidine kinase